MLWNDLPLFGLTFPKFANLNLFFVSSDTFLPVNAFDNFILVSFVLQINLSSFFGSTQFNPFSDRVL